MQRGCARLAIAVFLAMSPPAAVASVLLTLSQPAAAMGPSQTPELTYALNRLTPQRQANRPPATPYFSQGISTSGGRMSVRPHGSGTDFTVHMDIRQHGGPWHRESSTLRVAQPLASPATVQLRRPGGPVIKRFLLALTAPTRRLQGRGLARMRSGAQLLRRGAEYRIAGDVLASDAGHAGTGAGWDATVLGRSAGQHENYGKFEMESGAKLWREGSEMVARSLAQKAQRPWRRRRPPSTAVVGAGEVSHLSHLWERMAPIPMTLPSR